MGLICGACAWSVMAGKDRSYATQTVGWGDRISDVVGTSCWARVAVGGSTYERGPGWGNDVFRCERGRSGSHPLARLGFGLLARPGLRSRCIQVKGAGTV